MAINLQNLPSKISALHQMIFTLDAEKIAFIEKTNFLEAKDKAQSEEILKLTEQLRLLKNKLYGKSSEKMDKTKSQKIQEEIATLELKIENTGSKNLWKDENFSSPLNKAKR